MCISSVLFVLCIICDVCMVLQMEAYDVAIKSCESVLREEPQNTKALFRKGKVSLNVVSACRVVVVDEWDK